MTDDLVNRMRQADVILLGEIHDNPDHHMLQAEIIETLQPSAIVWEMLTDETAARINAGALDNPANFEAVIEWAKAHWPNFDLYRPVLVAAEDLQQYGGLVPRAAASKAMELGIGPAFGAGSGEYGLGIRLDPAQQSVREAHQQEAHCNAMPPELLPKMVDVQRLRDATLAKATIRAFDDTGGPIVVVTGNGHARKDWGVSVYLKRVQPALRVFSLGQSEDGSVRGIFDAVVDSPAVERPDPCAAFEKQESE
ncbi:ChaN family lipoprotein [Falsiphaeobacter marinintestinus]|uniref:ChaN family lipoprotein n=1 Tax=Falsiphaeobacter marinintestinus TaxID=1492905 RepID=UPI001FE2F9D1|nr:ChaN family lipoprotein [Phaeobacter marinintestinus]